MLAARAVLERYDVCDKTLDRWLGNPALEFPRPVKINTRRYWYLSQLEQWERKRVVARTAA
jgi:predicted DNA-binding transcriptional regulator AlpA